MQKIRVKTDRIEVEAVVDGRSYTDIQTRVLEIISNVSKAHQDIAKSESNQNADK